MRSARSSRRLRRSRTITPHATSAPISSTTPTAISIVVQLKAK
jgi:hypothetical protein